MFPAIRFIMPFTATKQALLTNTCPTVADVVSLAIVSTLFRRQRPF